MRTNGEIVFSARVAVPNEQAVMSNLDVVKHKQYRFAEQLGLKIAEEKGWYEWEENGLLMSDIRLYVFTPQELKDFVDIKLQKKLKELGIDENSLHR